MHSIDITVLIILIYNFFHGLIKGFLKQAFDLVGIFAGFFLAKNCYFIFSNWMIHTLFIPPKYSQTISFPLLFLSIFFVFSLIGKIFHKGTEILFVSWLDHLAGGILGVIIGIFWIYTIFIALEFLPFYEKIYIELSKTVSFFWYAKIAYFKHWL